MNATDLASSGGPASARRWAGVLVAALLTAGLALAQAPGGRVIVADVIPQGNRVMPTQRIMSLIRTRPGAEYQKDVAAEDVRRLFETKAFADVRVAEKFTDDGKVVVYFQLAELPSVIQEVVYQGAKHLK